MTRQFLSLEDAVLIAQREFDIDPEIARIEFEQKCYITDNQYLIGYDDGLVDATKAITQLRAINTVASIAVKKVRESEE